MENSETFLADPYEQFLFWFNEAKKCQLDKPESFALASVGLDSFPKVRTLLFKGFYEKNLSFFTNYNSHKSQEIRNNPKVTAMFYWHPPLDLQVRIEGEVSLAPKELSDQYFASRPRDSQIGAWASPQSEFIASREDLDHAAQEIAKKFEGKEVPRPEFWGGYLIKPRSFEFMVLKHARLHDRVLYTQTPGSEDWSQRRMAP